MVVRNLARDRGPVEARSINAIATLGVRQGHEIEVRASGPQAAEALKGADFFDVAKYPTLEFKSRKVIPRGKDKNK